MSLLPLKPQSCCFFLPFVLTICCSIQATVKELLPLPVAGQIEEIDSTLVSEIRVRVSSCCVNKLSHTVEPPKLKDCTLGCLFRSQNKQQQHILLVGAYSYACTDSMQVNIIWDHSLKVSLQQWSFCNQQLCPLIGSVLY